MPNDVYSRLLRASRSCCSKSLRRGLAIAAQQVPDAHVSDKGPTAIVFMNMGGPSSTGEVGDFLSRLFVCTPTAPVSPPLVDFLTLSKGGQ